MSPFPQTSLSPRRHWKAFSLIELLAVIAVIATLSAVSMPALQSIKGGNNVNKAVADLSSTLELARTYAMANRAYVRILLSENPASGNQMLPVLVAQTVYSANGSATGDMASTTDWPALGRPLVLENLRVYDTIQGSNTVNDVTPMGGNVQGTFMSPVSRTLPGRGAVSFTGVIQFSPTGEARVSFDEPARYIKLALDQPNPGNPGAGLKKNPFVLRLSGMNGSIKILRAGELAL